MTSSGPTCGRHTPRELREDVGVCRGRRDAAGAPFIVEPAPRGRLRRSQRRVGLAAPVGPGVCVMQGTPVLGLPGPAVGGGDLQSTTV